MRWPWQRSQERRVSAAREEQVDDTDREAEDHASDPEVVELPITDTIDLHSFRPQEIADVVRDFLDAAHEAGYRELRFIHGRGRGVQRKTVRTILERDPRVVDFRDGAEGGGNWGATVARLRELA